MGHIYGNTAENMSRTYPGDHRGVHAQSPQNFWRQVAKLMIQLASIRLPKIGSIIRHKSDPSIFVAEPLVETGSGPYDSTAAFYAGYPVASGKHLAKEGQEVRGQEELLQASQPLAASSTQAGAKPAAGLGLSSYDPGPNNIMVDREFNDPAVIKRQQLGPKFAEVVEAGGQDLGGGNEYDSASKPRTTLLFRRSGFGSKEAVAFRSLTYAKMKQDQVNDE